MRSASACRAAGFSLIELACVLVLVAAIGSVALQTVQTTTTSTCAPATTDQLRDIRAAIQSYVSDNNLYPLPARRQVGINDPSFGRAVGQDALADIDSAGTAYIGALPFITLGLKADEAADCWGNKFTYVVTKSLTDSGTYSNNAGSITINKGTLANPQTITAHGAYAVISHGQDALGAAAKNYTGQDRKYCNIVGSNAVARTDQANCDTENDILFSADFNNTVTDGHTSANFFDDMIIYGEKTLLTNCGSGTINWNGHCAALVGSIANGASAQVSNSTAGYSGSATVRCEGGTHSIIGDCTAN